MENVRSCQFKTSNVWEDGYFHTWGSTLSLNTDNNYSIGIIEDKKGYVHIIEPYNIRFTDKYYKIQD